MLTSNSADSGPTRHGARHDAQSGEEHARERTGMPRRHPQVHGRVDQGPLCQPQPTIESWPGKQI